MVGRAGVGGGSLMAPIMILLLGVAPTTAVGTDLWFAALTKIVGGAVHSKHGNERVGPDLQVVKRLCLGSLPAAMATLWILSRLDLNQIRNGPIMQLLGGVLIATAVTTLLGGWFHKAATQVRASNA